MRHEASRWTRVRYSEDVAQSRYAVEVYPHPIHVRLFGLDERLPYKRKKGRNVAFIRHALQQYQAHTEALIKHEAPRVLENADVLCAMDSETAQNARGCALKRLDDTLDGLTCTLAAWVILEATRALGDDRRPERLHRRAAGGLEGVAASVHEAAARVG